ncbi:MAG: lysophospholipase [Proteobacteria bacterium]|nr:lysophospholipase [Pseudomonadota bacterium]
MLPAVLALAAACAPRLQPAGPPLAAAALAPDAVIAADGARLPLRRSLPEGEARAVILALHGFNDYRSAFDAAAGAWRALGIATYAYDQRGFGEAPGRGLWPGTEALVADARAAAAAVRARHPGVPFYLLGESMGGAVAVLAASGEEPVATDGVILVAPAVWGWSTMNPLQAAALWVAAHTVPWLTLRGDGLRLRASDNLEALRALSRDPLVIKATRVDSVYGLASLMEAALAAAPRFDARALVLYGRRDEIVPSAPVRRFLAGLPAAASARQTVARYDAGFHLLLRDLAGAVVTSDIAAWVLAPGAALPSRADLAGAAWRRANP